jgi:anti-sigma factor RsiW
MTCAEFREGYSDYHDSLITAQRKRWGFHRHIAQCPACRRYDARVRRGMLALQAGARSISPSPGFRHRLEARLAQERPGDAELPRRAGIAAALFLAVMVGLLALEGTRRPEVTQAPPLPPVPFPRPVAHAGVPFVSFQDPRASVVVGNPSAYETVLVEPVSAGR